MGNRVQRRRAAHSEKSLLPEHLTKVDLNTAWEGISKPEMLIEVWQSSKYLVQVHRTSPPYLARIVVMRVRNKDLELSREELLAIKYAIGYGDSEAIEPYPAKVVTNHLGTMRTLWVLLEPLKLDQ